MAQAKYTIYKYVKLSGGKWRYCRSALYKNHTIKPNIVKVRGKEEPTPNAITASHMTAGGSMSVPTL